MASGSTAFSRAAAADVTVDIGFAIDGLKYNNASVSSSNYSISDDGKSITIKKEYLATLANGSKTFKIELDNDNTYVLYDVVISGSIAATFARGEAADVTVGVADATITGLKFNNAAVDASNYSITNSSHSITIKKEYLATLSNGAKTFRILEGASAYDECVVTISGNGSASFSKAAAADITVEVADATITGLQIGSANVNTDNYTIAEGAHSITIDDEYLGGLANGEKTFHILLGESDELIYKVTIGD